MENKSFLVTGGAGFIGSHIVEYLLEHHAKFVRIVDNLSTGNMANINHLLQKYKNIEFIFGDVTNYDICWKCVDGIDIICHQAALGSIPRSIDNPLNTHNSNVNGFLNILEAARRNKVHRIVYASSSSVYGDDTNIGKIEDCIGKQLSPYAITKYIDELYADIYTKLYGLECIGLRYFNVFGPRQSPIGPYAAVIPKFINTLKKSERPVINGDGSFSRDFTFVTNVVQANMKAMSVQNKDCYGQVFNIGCGNKTSILELVHMIKELIGTDVNPIFTDQRKGDVAHSVADISKAKLLLNYEPHITVYDGLVKICV